MPDEGRKQRALEAVAKYKGRLTSDERIAAFAAWFAEQEVGWKDTRKEPPIDMALVLLKDSKLNTFVSDTARAAAAGVSVSSQCRFVPQLWARIP